MESVIKIIQLWLDFLKVAKHGFQEFSWWKVFRKITKLTWFDAKRFAYKTKKKEQTKKTHTLVIFRSHFVWICTMALFYNLSTLSASKLLEQHWKLPQKHAIMHEWTV